MYRDARGFALLALPAEVREMDRRTIEELALPGRVLMELAGAGTARAILARQGGAPGAALVLCGGGNNGGDGYVVARHLRDAGYEVRCISTVAADRLRGDARDNRALWEAVGGAVHDVDQVGEAALTRWLAGADVVVDALFGTGLTRAVEGAAAALIRAANGVAAPLKVAVDVPSGVDAARGEALGVAFRADLTTTYGVAKAGLYLAEGAALAGEVAVVEIGLPRAVVEAVGASFRLATAPAIAALLPARPPDGHKGRFGHVGVVGGFAGREGAARLAARGALRSGAGLVTWLTPSDEAPAREPEIMHAALTEGLDPRPTVFVVGPGLGTDRVAQTALATALDDGRPLVLDADALNLLAAGHGAEGVRARVITPHPGEAARLLGSSISEVQADRLGAAQRLVDAFDAVVVLKGARSVVAAPGAPAVLFDLPTAALSTGGSGDVLAGVIAGLMAQGCGALEAAWVAVWVHAQAGRVLGEGRAQRGVFASEIADALPAAIDRLAQGWG